MAVKLMYFSHTLIQSTYGIYYVISCKAGPLFTLLPHPIRDCLVFDSWMCSSCLIF